MRSPLGWMRRCKVSATMSRAVTVPSSVSNFACDGRRDSRPFARGQCIPRPPRTAPAVVRGSRTTRTRSPRFATNHPAQSLHGLNCPDGHLESGRRLPQGCEDLVEPNEHIFRRHLARLLARPPLPGDCLQPGRDNKTPFLKWFDAQLRQVDQRRTQGAEVRKVRIDPMIKTSYPAYWTMDWVRLDGLAERLRRDFI